MLFHVSSLFLAALAQVVLATPALNREYEQDQKGAVASGANANRCASVMNS